MPKHSRPTMLRLVAPLATVFAGLVLVVVPPVRAEAETRIADTGWWWRAQTGLGTMLPSPPNVGEDQLLVQSSPEGAQAIAAVSVVLADGQVNPVLTLDVAQDGGGGAQAVLLACQAGAAWTGASAGRWDSKPIADCATSVTGIRSEDGSQWTFPAGPLQFNDKLNVVLVPGTVAGSDVPSSFSLVFEPPTAASVVTVDGEAPPPVTAPPAAPVSTTVPAGGSSVADVASPTFPPVTSPLAAVPALDPADLGQTATAPIVNEASPPLAASPVVSADDIGSRTLARTIGIVVALAGLAGAVAVGRAGGLGGAPATADAPVEGGLARFRSTRSGEPTPIS